ncbi:MAG: hypothetical protein IJN42_05270, partial [Clostridia bacterium]|nr:hypothetical protein [Clostridia bacterium]
MSKFKRVCSVALCLLMVLGMIPAVTVSAAAPTNYTLSAAASQVRRMWCQQSYNTNDYVYGNVPIFWGRVMYVRFLDTNDLDTDVKKAVLKFDARCRTGEKTIRVAALALSDAQAQATAENNLQSATQTLKYYYPKATEGMGGANTKLMLDKSGYYLPAVSGSVVAYGEFTASDTPTTEDTYQLEKQNQLFEYPVTVELDVTNAVRSARAAGKKNVQFVIMLPKDVYVNGSVNLGDLSDFGGYANGVVYDA